MTKIGRNCEQEVPVDGMKTSSYLFGILMNGSEKSSLLPTSRSFGGTQAIKNQDHNSYQQFGIYQEILERQKRNVCQGIIRNHH